MSIITYPLNDIDYEAADVETYLSTRTSGVFSNAEDFAISVTGDRTVTIAEGMAWIKNAAFAGKSICSKAPVALTIDAADGSLPRIDRIVLRFDASLNASVLAVKKGTPASAPSAPAVERSALVYELGLYTVRIPAASISIADADITDTRADTSVCGKMRDGVTDDDKLDAADILFLGTCPISSVEDDTPANWRALGAGYCRYNKAGLLNNQPSTYGFLINYVHNDTGDVFQLWKSLASGAVYNRSGNAGGWYDGGFKKMYDTGNLLDATYPVGSIYMSANSTSPASLFGGTWERIYGRFLIGQSSAYPAGNTGGSATHTLTAAQMPSVTGRIQLRTYNGAGNIVAAYPDLNQDGCFTYTEGGGAMWSTSIYGTQTATAKASLITFNNGGQGAAHSNMPPWLSVYMWERVS